MEDKFVDFNNGSIPLGKRKVAFVKWAMKKGTSKIKAQVIANKKFGTEYKCICCGKTFNGKYLNKCPDCGE